MKKTPTIMKKKPNDKISHDNFFLFSGQNIPKIIVMLHTR